MPNLVNTRVTITVVPRENGLTKETHQGIGVKTIDRKSPEIPITESLNAKKIIGATLQKILPLKEKIKTRKIIANESHTPKKINPEGGNRIILKTGQTRSEKKPILIKIKARHRKGQLLEAFYLSFLVAKIICINFPIFHSFLGGII
jgi:hypothetical protein